MTKPRTCELFAFAPARGRRGGSVGKRTLSKMACMVFVFCAATAIASPAQTFTSFVDFDGTNGAYPDNMSLVQGFDGNLYGTTYAGGAKGDGTVFKITDEGTLTKLYSFCSETSCTDGASPTAGLVQATNGDLYGTTLSGGANGDGTVFEITPAGKLTTLYSFTGGNDGGGPYAGLIQATNGDFYGTTYAGGANGDGTIFEITPAGKLATLYSFCSETNCTDGASPTAGLVQATDGDFYGTTFTGAESFSCSLTSGCGTVFKITPAGTLTTLHSFCSETSCPDGSLPTDALLQATNGDFYGTTEVGGANGYGTVFKITPSGTLTTLYSFTGGNDGGGPYAGLIQAPNGDFYGTTLAGGGSSNCTDGCGTVFDITPAGKPTTLHSFDSTDGANSSGGLLQATNGTFYGTTYNGGADNDGTVFSLSVGLGPFVKTLPTSGKVGTAVIILGTNLTGTTSVSFNSTAATFTVVSKSEIKTTVPAGATTGTVEVTTPKKTLKSNVAFRVKP